MTRPAAPAEGKDLGRCVRQALEEYLGHLGGHDPTNLHELVIREVEQPLLAVVMTHCGGNQTRAAALLGINRTTLRKKLKEHGLGG